MGVPLDTGQFGSPSGGSFGSSVLGAIPLVGGILNGVTQMFTNSSNRRFQVSMYKRQRADALTDWNMQNEYNSPAAQMARLQSAGLNPNLVYGHGADAQMGAPVRQSSPSGGNAVAPRFDFQGVFSAAMLQLKEQMQAQQLSNLQTQNLVLQSQIPKNIAQTQNIETDTEAKRFALNLANATRDIDIALKSGNLRRLDVGTDVMLDANDRAAAMQAPNLQLAAIRVVQGRLDVAMNPLKRDLLQAQIDALNSSSELRKTAIDLQKDGLTMSDNVMIRLLHKILGDTRMPSTPQLEHKMDNLKWHKEWVKPFTPEWWNR